MVSDWKYVAAGNIIGFSYSILSATWKYKFLYDEEVVPFDLSKYIPDRSIIIAHWHGDELALIGMGKKYKFLTFSSQSKDGTIMAAALKQFGFKVIRGSSSRGGTRALVSMIRVLRENSYYVSFAIDGPRGPRRQAKPGVYYVAYKAGISIIQCQVKCNRSWQIPNTWNKAYIPKPFARITVKFNPVPQATKENQSTILEVLDSRGEDWSG